MFLKKIIVFCSVLWSATIFARPNCTELAIQSLFNSGKTRGIVSKLQGDQARFQIKKHLLKKGLSVAQANRLADRLILDNQAFAGHFLEIVRKIPNKRFATNHADRVIPYVMRKIEKFHEGVDLNVDGFAKIISTWTDEELAGLGRVYDEAIEKVSVHSTREERLLALETTLAEKSGSKGLAKKLAKCAVI